MRIVPLTLIAFGVFGVLKHFGLIDPAFVHLFWPLLLIGIGLALLARGPRWHTDLHEHRQDRWERRMHRHFGPGWTSLSDEERERFRGGMRQWRSRGGFAGNGATAPPESGNASPKSTVQTPSPGEQR